MYFNAVINKTATQLLPVTEASIYTIACIYAYQCPAMTGQ